MLSSGLRISLLPPLLLLLLTAMELSWSFTNEEKKLIVDLHNQYRSMVSPPAADMLKMSWDSELEAFAKDYSTKCIWEHNKERGRRGENLFAMTGRLDLDRAVEDWYIEYQFYNISTLACEEGQMCGHYTQVVWASSERVGCGTTFCETMRLLNETDMHLLVCNYEPPGNIKGRKPYSEGAPCSLCPAGYSCKNSLCESSTGEEETTEPPITTELDSTTILTTSPDLQSATTVSAVDTPETPRAGTEGETEPTATEGQITTPTVSPNLQFTITVAAEDMTKTPKAGIDTESEPTTMEGTTPSLEPISDQDLKISPSLQTSTDGIVASLVTTSTMSFLDSLLTPDSVSPQTGTDKATGTEFSSEDGLITSQTTISKTEQPVTTLPPVHSTSKTLLTPTRPFVPKTPSVPKIPSIPKPPSVHEHLTFFHPPSVAKPHFYPKPPPIPKKPPISKTPARHRLMAYSKAIQRRNNAVQSSADKAAKMSVCLPCLGCKQISQPEEIKVALKELTSKYPYAPCFSSLPRWQRHK